MLNLNSRIVSLMESEQRHNFTEKAKFLFSNGTYEWLSESEFSVSNNSYSDTTGGTDFPVGKTICRTVSIEIMNLDGKFDDYDFYMSKIDLYLMFKDDDGSYVDSGTYVGTFWVTNPATMGDIITMDAVDAMWMTEKSFYSTLSFPTTVGTLFREICTKTVGDAFCGDVTFKNADVTLTDAPSGDFTFRTVIGYIACLAGGNAIIDLNRKLQIKTLDLSIFAEPEKHSEVQEIDQWESLTQELNDTKLDGVMATYSMMVDGKQTSEYIAYGDTGDFDYHIEITNPLYSLISTKQEALNSLAYGFGKIVGFPFRVFNGTIPCDPRHEIFDAIRIRNANPRIEEAKRYSYSFITDVTVTVCGDVSLKNTVPSSIQATTSFTNPYATIINNLEQQISGEITARESAVALLTETINTHGALYSFYEYDSTTSAVTAIIIQDQPKGSNPSYIIRVTASGIAMSNDGGKTYQIGMSVTGETVTKLLYAAGINAEYIYGDMIVGKGLNIGVWNSETETVTALLDVVDSKVSIQVSSATSNLATKEDVSSVESVANEALTKAETPQEEITTTTGYTFNADGLLISQDGSDISNKLDNEGMYVKRIDSGVTTDVLTANKEGVNAINLTARQYLTIGENSRFEDYEASGKQRTACFFIGG